MNIENNVLYKIEFLKFAYLFLNKSFFNLLIQLQLLYKIMPNVKKSKAIVIYFKRNEKYLGIFLEISTQAIIIIKEITKQLYEVFVDLEYIISGFDSFIYY